MITDGMDLALEVAQGNPGALSVIRQLMWYSKWHEMMRYMLKNKIVGPEVWVLYKDKFHEDITKTAEHLEKLMSKDKEFKHFYGN